MNAAHTSYDAVAYPSLIFGQSHPDRLAVNARLHGLDPPEIESARYLEIGGGDGLNAIALAAAFPQGLFVNFDIAAAPIERARAWSAAAGLDNVRHLQLDLLDAADTLEDRFDYIVAHGVYAWTPDHVRAAVMPQIARLLSPRGIAFVSYNALPGSYGRMALRDMMMHHIAPLIEPRARIAAAQALLRSFVTPETNDAPITTAMRMEARVALTYADGLLYHDQLNQFYAPQALTTVVADAQAHGLRYLGDARGGGVDQGFLDPGKADLSEADWVAALQSRDYRHGRYFRSSLFVHADAPVSRVAVPHAARTMWASCGAASIGATAFRMGERRIEISDPDRAAILHRLVRAQPDRLPIADLTSDPGMLAALCHLALEGFIELHTTASPFALCVPETPVASPLARMQIDQEHAQVATLAHRMITLEPQERQLVSLLDGARDHAELARTWSGSRSLADTLAAIASKALLVR